MSTLLKWPLFSSMANKFSANLHIFQIQHTYLPAKIGAHSKYICLVPGF